MGAVHVEALEVGLVGAHEIAHPREQVRQLGEHLHGRMRFARTRRTRRGFFSAISKNAAFTRA